jgi:hypothetical protein
VTTAAWWCQKQPPRPMAAAMVMAKAIKMRIAFPSFLPSTTEKRELLCGSCMHHQTNRKLLPRSHSIALRAPAKMHSSLKRQAYSEGCIMGPIKMLDALVEEHGPVVAFLVPCLALVASFFFLALLSG